MMKKLLFSLCAYTLSMCTTLFAQEYRNVLVEHFTNTRCSACAARNPGLFENLDNHPEVLHIAYHPSAPYANCVINQHNPQENDDRTNYYGIYGGTPRLVIMGEVQSAGVDFSSAEIFAQYDSLIAGFDIHLEQKFTSGGDSFTVDVNIQRISSTNDSVAWLHLMAVEAFIAYNSPNGEDEHHNVFRRTFFGSAGKKITLPMGLNESVNLKATIPFDEDWSYAEIYALALLQNSNAEILQAESGRDQPILNTFDSADRNTGLEVYPVPANDRLFVSTSGKIVTIFDITGKTIYDGPGGAIRTAQWDNGIYFVALPGYDAVKKVVIQH
ncbi:MAG: hypothetical protein Kow0075_01640 [Salibacteraceae bacterium]